MLLPGDLAEERANHAMGKLKCGGNDALQAWCAPDWLHVEGKRMQRLDYRAKHVNNVHFKRDLATRRHVPVTPTGMKSP